MDDWCRVLTGDCRQTLKDVEAGSVQTCITSPPYWGLRDYGTASWEDGDPDCDHVEPRQVRGKGSEKQKTCNEGEGGSTWMVCGKCGAIRVDDQIGIEESPDAYVASMVEVFRQVHRVLRDDGTIWVNLGDSYSSGSRTSQVNQSVRGSDGYGVSRPPPCVGLKPKDLVGIPWRVAFGLQADGWFLRQDIIWHKPNPMPESVTDRCTKAHEYFFLLSKSKSYHYDHEAIMEETTSPPHKMGNTTAPEKGMGGLNNIGDPSRVIGEDGLKNKRSVWSVTAKGFNDAHFATMPEELVTPCVLASTRPGDTVLDPFGGSGTTGKVAIENGRRAILCELNPDYVGMIQKRTSTTIGFGF